MVQVDKWIGSDNYSFCGHVRVCGIHTVDSYLPN